MASNSRDYVKPTEYELDDARYDQPVLVAGVPRRDYVICTTPRCGSWLLCRQLFNAGLGVPSEYFNVRHVVELSRRWGLDPRDTRAYLDALRARRTTPQRRVGHEAHVDAVRRSTQRAQDRAGGSRASAVPRARRRHLRRPHRCSCRGRPGCGTCIPIPTTAPRDDIRFELDELASLERVMAARTRCGATFSARAASSRW
jgi:hypothetical protein